MLQVLPSESFVVLDIDGEMSLYVFEPVSFKQTPS